MPEAMLAVESLPGSTLPVALTGIECLWKRTRGSSAVSVAVIDGPADLNHPCLSGGNLTVLNQFGSTCRRDGLSCAHGTHVTSIIFAQHGSHPMRGIAPQCRGILIPFFRDDIAGQSGVSSRSQVELAHAIDLARRAGAWVINISSGQFTSTGKGDMHLAAAVRQCHDNGVLIVAAAGNDGCDCLHLPAALPGVLTVGASGNFGQPASFSNYGHGYRSRGILAPGTDIPAAVPGGGYTLRTGTSFAAPLVSGVVALLLSLEPETTAASQETRQSRMLRICSILFDSLDSCPDDSEFACQRYLAGRLNLVRLCNTLDKGNASMAQDTWTSDQSVNGHGEQLIAAQQPWHDDSGETVDVQETNIQPQQQVTERVVPARAATSEGRVSAGNATATVPRTPGGPPRSASQLQPTAAGGVLPASCGCGGGGAPRLVYALGSLSYDFATQARYDAIAAEIAKPIQPFPLPPVVGTFELLELLNRDNEPYHAASFIWTLNHDATPLYAVRPEGAYAAQTYARLVEFLSDQIDPAQMAERVSIPGIIDGSVRLMSGQTVPVIIPELRGMANWTTKALVDSVCGAEAAEGRSQENYESRVAGVMNFLRRVYYDIRNLGQEPQHRALNYAATNAFQLDRVFELSASKGLELDEISADPSPIGRQDSDCWEIRLTFFNPDNALASRTQFQYTIDVSDVVPVQIGDFRSWSIR